MQQALIHQAEATIDATEADLLRYQLEVQRQRNLLKPESPDAAACRAGRRQREADAAQRRLNEAQLDQQKAALAASTFRKSSLRRNSTPRRRRLRSRRQSRYTRILSPADGLVGQRQVRPGQFVNVGTQVIAVLPLPNLWVIANFKETQMTNVRVGQPARVAVDAFPDLKLTGHVDSWSPGTGSTFALLPPDNATGNFTKVVQRVPVKIVLDQNRRLAPWCGRACPSSRRSTPARLRPRGGAAASATPP